MKGVRARSTLAIAGACACVRIAVACSSDYAGEERVSPVADAADTAPPSEIGEAGSDAGACAPRYMPAEGTYAYGHLYSADNLTLADSSVPTEPFDNPFFATVTHEPNACWRFTAYLADGWDAGKGGHHHSWLFCNACDRAQPSLNLVEEKDVFGTTQLGVVQRTTFTCLGPNPYLATDVPIDGSLAQPGCTGVGTGGTDNEVQVLPMGNHYLGVRTLAYQQTEAGIDAHVFERLERTVIKDGTEQKDDKSSFYFDVDTGMIIAADLMASTTTRYGTLDVSYEFTLFFRPVSSTVSPLHRDQ